jgi:cysteine desulfuration protein SufE
MALIERQKQLEEQFSGIEDWEERYRAIIKRGKALAGLPDDLKQDKYKVKGCQSQVWLHARLDDEQKVVFRADSDAMIVRGLISMLLEVYSDAAPQDILDTPPEFIKSIGLESHLSPTRTNGLRSMIEQMFYYAKAFQTLLAARGAN